MNNFWHRHVRYSSLFLRAVRATALNWSCQMAGFSRPNMTYMAGTWLKTPVNSFLETNSRPVFYFVYFIVLFYYFFLSVIWTPDIPISLPSQIFQVNIWWSYSHLGFTGIRTKALCLLIVPKQHFFFGDGKRGFCLSEGNWRTRLSGKSQLSNKS